jgi:5'-methylthioadenosine phosphorylase
MLGIIGGTSLLFSDLPDLEKRIVHTPYGNSEVLCGDIAILLRHQHTTPPHQINYRSHLAALAILGVTRIVAIGSAGSLKREIPPGSLVIPTDYISTTVIPSIHERAIRHVHPGMCIELAQKLHRIVPDARYGGVYVQTKGPRIETIAEVKALSHVADIVGMTLASEATLAIELGMDFAAICPVDNYANGLGDETLTYQHILDYAGKFRERTDRMMQDIVKELA